MANGPITLTPKQFAATSAAKSGGTYKGYRRYIGKRRASLAAAAAADPYSGLIQSAPRPYTSPQVQQQVSRYTAGLPTPQTDAEIQTEAQGMISPLVQAAVGNVNQQLAAEQAAIRGYTQDVASKLAAIDYGSPYTTAETAQASVDSALHDALSGAGSDAAKSLASRLAAINDPSVAAAAQAVQNTATGNANANLAGGSTNLGALIADQAALRGYGIAQPGIVQLSGVQELGKAAGTAQQQIADQTQQYESQLPQIIQSLQSRSDTAASNRSNAAEQLFQFLTGQNTDASKNLLALRENQIARNDALAAGAAKNQAAITIAGEKAAAAGGKAPTTRQINGVTNQWVPGTGWVPLPGVGKSGKAMSPTQIQSYVKAITNTKTVRVSDGAGRSTSSSTIAGHRVNYGQAYKYLTNHGVSDQDARIALDASYKRGVDGRAWLSNEEQTVLKQAAAARGKTRGAAVGLKGVQVKDILAVNVDPVSHHRFLSPVQYEILKAAGKLPPGSFQDTPLGKRWYIAQ